MRLPQRILAVLALVISLLVSVAGPASAHTVGGSGATNFHTVLDSFNAPAGITLKVAENGGKLVLANRTSTPITVLGYQQEPYLLVSPSGVQANQKSQATFSNIDRYLTNVVIPASANNIGTDYQTISGKPIAIWHDHRIHWMSTTLPPLVAADPGTFRVVQNWQIHFLYAGKTLTAAGELDWVPGPSPLPWVGLTIGALIVCGVLALRSRRLLAVVLGVLVVADIAHTLGVAADRAGATVAGGFGAYPVVDAVWVLALAGAVLLATGRRLRIAAILAVATGAWMLLIGGLADVATFHDSTAPFLWSINGERVLTGVEIAAGVSVVVAAVRMLLTLAPEGGWFGVSDDDDEDEYDDAAVAA